MESNTTSASTTSQTPPKRHRWLKILALLVAGIVILLLLGVLAVPTVLSSSGGTRFLLSRINRSVDGQVDMEKFSVGWFSGVELTNLSFESNDGVTQVNVGRIETQPRYASLFGGRIDMGKTIIDRPHVYMKLHPEPLTAPADRPTADRQTPFMLPVHLIDLDVREGDATFDVVDANAQIHRISFKNIASSVVLNEPGQTSRMNMSMDITDGQSVASLQAEGEATPPKKGWTLEDTDGTFSVSINTLDLESLSPLLAIAGVDVQTGGVLNADATIRIRKGNIETLTAEATVANFSQGIGDQKMVFDEPVTLIARGGLKDNAIQIDELNIKTPFCTITGSGDAEMLDYAVKADLAQTQTFIRQFSDMAGFGMAGQLDLTGRVNMAENTIASTGKGTVKDLLIRKDTAAAPQTDVSLDYDVTMDSARQRLTIAAATLSMAPGTIRVNDVSVPTGQDAAQSINLTAQADLDMAKAWPYAQVLADAPMDIALAGLLDATVSVQTRDDTLHVKTDRTRIRNLRVAKQGSEPFVQEQVNLIADLTLNMARQSIGIHTFDMQSADGETLIKIIKGTVEQSTDEQTHKMDAEIEAEYDLETISAFAAPYLPDGLKVQGKRQDRFVLSSEWPADAPQQRLANLNGTGGLGFDRAEYFGLNVGPTELAMTIQQGIVNLALPETAVNNGKMRFAGTINLAEEPMFLRLNEPTTLLENIAINDAITSQILTYVNPVFVGAVRTSGMANFTCRKLALPLSGEHMDQMDIDGTIGIANIQLQAGDFLGAIMRVMNLRSGMTMNLRPTNFLMQRGRVSYRDMQIDLGDYPLSFSGSLGLDKQLSMDVRLPLGLDFRPVRLADADSQRIEISLGGTVDNPSIDVERLIQNQLQQQLQQQLRRLF